MDGGAWWATVHRVAKSRTQLMLCHSLMFRIIFSNIRNRFQQKKKKKNMSLTQPSWWDFLRVISTSVS